MNGTIPPALRGFLEKLGRLVLSPRTTPLLVVAVGLGSVAGLLSAAFWNAIAALSDALSYLVVRPLDRAFPLPWSIHWGFWVPAVGGLAAGLLAHFVFRTPHRLGVPAVMLDARREWGKIPLRYVPATFINAALTIGTGGSAGREAPVVAMGGGVGAWLARRMQVPRSQRRLLVGCGAAAAIAAAFNAPLAGVFFALEVLLGDWRAGTLAPVMLASVAGTVVARAAEGGADASHFQVPPYHLAVWWEVAIYAAMGIFAGAIGHMFVRSLDSVEERFDKLNLASWVKPAIGGLGVGIIGLAIPGVLGNGYPYAIAAAANQLPWNVLLLLVAGKIVATSLTLGSGGWGGDFAPTLFIGAMLGGVYGKLAGAVFGAAVAPSGAYAMVGMGAMLAAVVHCPATAVLLLFELTGSYEVILPIMVSVTTATFVARRFSPDGIYHQRLRALGGPAFEVRGGHALAHVTVDEVMRRSFTSFPLHAPYQDVLQEITESSQFAFPVIDDDGAMTGLIRLADVRAYLLESGPEIPVVAADLALEEVPLVTTSTSAEDAAAMLAAASWEELPVVTSNVDRRPVGLVSRHDVLRSAVKAWSDEVL